MTENPDRSQLIRSLSAIMFSDIVGYSKKMGADEAGTLKLLATHNEVMKTTVPRYEGRIIKTAGDGTMASFQSAVNAVRCAMAIQERFRALNEPRPDDQKIQVRIGIHLGDVVVKDGDLFGDGVNIASRIEPIAQPGGICISQDVYNQVKNKIQIESVHLGPHELKNISEKIDLYHLVLTAQEKELLASRKLPKSLAATGGKSPAARWKWIAGGACVMLIVGVVAKISAAKKTQNPPEQTGAAGDKKIYSLLAVFPFETETERGPGHPPKRVDREEPGEHFSESVYHELSGKLGAMSRHVTLEEMKREILAAGGDKITEEKLPGKLAADEHLQRKIAEHIKADCYLHGSVTYSVKLAPRPQSSFVFDWALHDVASGREIAAGSHRSEPITKVGKEATAVETRRAATEVLKKIQPFFAR